MGAAILAILGFVCGATAVYFIFEPRRRRTEELAVRLKRLGARLDEDEERLDLENGRLNHDRSAFEEDVRRFQTTHAEFHRRVVQYDELVRENQILKTDLRNLSTTVAKQNHDQGQINERQKQLEAMADEVGRRYLSETQKWVSRAINSTNYVSNKNRLLDAINQCRGMGLIITKEQEAAYLAKLQQEYEAAVAEDYEREAQAFARQRLREEQQRAKELEQAEAQREQAEAERQAAQRALARAVDEAVGQQTEKVLFLQRQLAEVEAKLAERTERAISLAQLTKVGHVYVISNIGSFGEGVFKIGLTRREKPMDRVLELGDASVPFPFDVHMMIKSENAPELEHQLHKHFARHQVNKVNPRKEFFRIGLAEIAKTVERLHGRIEYTAKAEARQYHESLTMKPEDQEMIEEAYERAAAKSPAALFEAE